MKRTIAIIILSLSIAALSLYVWKLSADILYLRQHNAVLTQKIYNLEHPKKPAQEFQNLANLSKTQLVSISE